MEQSDTGSEINFLIEKVNAAQYGDFVALAPIAARNT